ncbi:condensation domain-containing protein [Streptomyces sp. NPDC059740]|uniref:condensation domain-containing protein n=1 Tax=Streptomyces sp. NPDC059740 TaxID=3346926 RepID=UPI003647D5EE
MKIGDLAGSGARPGRLLQWALQVPPGAGGHAPQDDRPPAYIQEAHLRNARAMSHRDLHAPSWVGTAFDVGDVDADTLEKALVTWTMRHETLRSGFRWDGDGDGAIHRFTLDAEEVALHRTDLGAHEDAEEVVRVLQERCDAATNALSWPNFVYLALQHDRGTRLYLAFDHINVDAYSIQLMPAQIHELLAAQAGAESVREDDSQSYVDFCELEREQADQVDGDDQVVNTWRAFLAACGGTMPPFPLETGVAPGELAPQELWTEALVDAEVTAAFDAHCRPSGGLLPGMLAASAVVVQEAGGPGTYRTVVPFHTRATSRWGASVGWYVGAVPVEIHTSQAGSFGEVLALARSALRGNRALARVPVERVLRLLHNDFRPLSPDLFSLTSYVDGRSVTGAASWPEWNTVGLLRVSRGDQVCVWITRSEDGLQFASRLPVNPKAQKNVGRYLDGLRAVLTSVARSGTYGE